MIQPFDIHYGKIQQAGSNTRLELKKDLRQELTRRGANLTPKTQAAITIQQEEEHGCIIVKVFFHKQPTIE